MRMYIIEFAFSSSAQLFHTQTYPFVPHFKSIWKMSGIGTNQIHQYIKWIIIYLCSSYTCGPEHNNDCQPNFSFLY